MGMRPWRAIVAVGREFSSGQVQAFWGGASADAATVFG